MRLGFSLSGFNKKLNDASESFTRLLTSFVSSVSVIVGLRRSKTRGRKLYRHIASVAASGLLMDCFLAVMLTSIQI
jgi:hypothetical protein